jgi:hypothetical protein
MPMGRDELRAFVGLALRQFFRTISQSAAELRSAEAGPAPSTPVVH